MNNKWTTSWVWGGGVGGEMSQRATRFPHHFAKGLMTWGCSMMKAGLIQYSSINSPTNCNKSYTLISMYTL
ncbi:hypothetical protein DPMN_170393 [Dreissena polymorpha]|uniref:Uncharacterized protein n=1 Tax=Dreissena polymorpha TaxID=45954 RepID=A0A9D4ICU3_DREPO|nr:hypothetical protein DPMN_170393 [Dreissena polymorpha]